ncbi:hypothetical protein X743_33585 [Mesorhizobium sp. LNHC252B00]|nr:hypothetical protein X743_33585 [Mesorhizobium sp. LNHC252B00]
MVDQHWGVNFDVEKPFLKPDFDVTVDGAKNVACDSLSEMKGTTCALFTAGAAEANRLEWFEQAAFLPMGGKISEIGAHSVPVLLTLLHSGSGHSSVRPSYCKLA